MALLLETMPGVSKDQQKCVSFFLIKLARQIKLPVMKAEKYVMKRDSRKYLEIVLHNQVYYVTLPRIKIDVM